MGWLDFFRIKKTSPILRYNLLSGEEEEVRRSWQKVEELLALGKPSQLKQAVIEADKILDFVLQRLVTGLALGERLRAARELWEKEVYEDLWSAHKVRNSLVHESGYDPPHFVCREAVAKIKQGLTALRIRL